MPLIHPPFRFLLLAAAAFSVWCLLPSSIHNSLIRRYIRDDVDRAINQALSGFVRTLQTGRSNSDALNVLAIGDVQDSLACHVQQGAWSDQTLTPSVICPTVERKSVKHVLSLCSMLRAKKILLVGPEATFHLHSLWLHDLSKYFNTSRKCLGPEFCTFHHACLDGALEASLSTTRVKKVPGSRELAAYESCILRFILSTTLYASNNPRDPAFTTPIIDQRTGIRTKNAFWMNQARKTDLLILNRGPVPAPAWTYYFSQKTMAGNWTFVDDLCSNASTKYFDLDNLYPQRSYHRYKRGICIINAALHATLSIFLPGIMETLTAIQKDAAIRTKNIVWHGTWYLNPTCTSYGSPKGFSVEPQLLPYDDSMYMVDPWTLYYNAQVYMHDKLLSILLPHVGIVYLPLSFPLAPANVTYKGTKRGQKNLFEEERKECIRYPFEEPEGRALEAAFLGGLVKLLEQVK